MAKSKSGSYFIIKLRSYASPYYLKLWHEKNSSIGLKKHMEACQKSNDFFVKLFEHVTGQDYYEEHTPRYFLGAKECAIEILESDFNIILSPGEGWFEYLIPKNNPQLFQWILDNKGDIPFKITKRSNIDLYFHQPTTWRREQFKSKSWERDIKIDKILN